MGQKVNPILFRSGVKKDQLSFSSPPQKPYLSNLLIQEIECKKFLFFLLKSRGILPRFFTFSRSLGKIHLDVDLYFTSLFLRESKLFWVRSLFKNMKQKYPKIRRVKDIKDFLENSQQMNEDLSVENFFFEKKKFLSTAVQNKKLFYQKLKKPNNFDFIYKRRLFYFLLFQKKKEILEKSKEKYTLYSINQNHLKLASPLVRMSLFKFNKLFGLRKLKYNFSGFFVRNFLSLKQKQTQSLLHLNKFLCQSLQNYTGVEEVTIRLSSAQLFFLPSFKFYKRFVLKELYSFQRNRDLKKYFLETIELLYFTLGSFGKGNASLLAKFIVYMLEKNRKQVFIYKFLKKSLQIFFQKLPKSFLAVDGIKILMKGRFNKRRRSKKLVLHEGQISLQSISTSLDYAQDRAVTLYGSFGIKVWISKRKKFL